MTHKVLIVDDIPDNIDILRKIIADIDCGVSVALNGEKALELVERNQPDLILLDVMMPGIDGFETCRRIRETYSKDEIIVIFVTGKQDEISAAFEAGGNDYIAKPINADEVVVRVRHQLEYLHLIRQLHTLNDDLERLVRQRTAELTVTNQQLREEVQERRYMQDRLKYLAEHDFVSHTYNRAALESHIAEKIAERIEHGYEYAYIQIDIDRFRLVNESCGCIAGDQLLNDVAMQVASCLGKEDFLARIGGDRFAILCIHRSELTGTVIAKQILELLSGLEFRWENREFTIAATIALVPLTDDVFSFDQLLISADELTYVGKRKGGNLLMSAETVRAGDQLNRRSGNWALHLVDALRQDDFRVYVQKIESLAANVKDYRFEALVRLYDRKRKQMMAPDSFLRAAERYHLIPDIDRLVIRKVCQFLHEQQTLSHKIAAISINLSALTLRDPILVEFVQSILADNQIDPAKLIFEVTETEQVIHYKTSSEILQGLKDIGCRIAIDDFGSGYASLNYLREFPFDIIKIDGVFVRDLDHNETNRYMVKSIVELAKKLEKPVVAEFVENATIVAILQELGVEWAQGFYFHRPEPLTAEFIQGLK